MYTNKNTGRIAGLFYLVVVCTGIHSLMYVPSQIIVWDNASVTCNNIKDYGTLYRAGLVTSIICYTAFLILPLILYRLLHEAHKTHAVLMVSFAMISVPISMISVVYKFNVLSILSGASYMYKVDPDHIRASVMLSLEAAHNAILVAGVFWGLWLIPFGYLIYRSAILPRFFGVLVIAGAFGYLINFLGYTFLLDYTELGIATYVSLPGTVGEIGICLWLLIAGARNRPTPVLSPPSLSS